jgi:hypothetical protein
VVSRRAALLLFGVLVFSAPSWPSNAEGQEAAADRRGDFTQWLQNTSYERIGYGKEGELETHQLIQFGALTSRETGCALPLRVISFDVTDRSRTKGDTELSLLVECSNPHLVANILKFVGDSDEQYLQAKIMGDELAYPEAPRDGMVLPDLHFTAKVKRGFLAFLGTKVKVTVSERTVGTTCVPTPDSPRGRAYEIHSTIRVKAFVIGLRVKTSRFSSHMVIDPINGPVEEILEHQNGSRTVIRAVSPSTERTPGR